jgi:hypothetical protein
MKINSELSGWVTLSRKILAWEWYDDINVSRLFIHLLLTVNHKPNSWHGVEIERGQRIIGYPALSEETRLSIRQLRTALSKLKTTGEVTVKTYSKFSVVTVKNYSEYQDKDRQKVNNVTGKRQSNDRQTTTNNNDNNDNNDKENNMSPFEEFKLQKEEVIKDLQEKFPTRDVAKAWKLIIAYYETHDHSKITNWKLHFEQKVQQDQFKSFTISPRFKVPEKPVVKNSPEQPVTQPVQLNGFAKGLAERVAKKIAVQKEIRSPYVEAKIHKGIDKLIHSPLRGKKIKEPTREERVRQVMGLKPEKEIDTYFKEES